MDLPSRPIVRNAALGALFGACFPAGAVLFLLWTHGAPGGPIATLLHFHGENPLLFMIDTAPLFLGLFAALAGWQEARLQNLSRHLEDQVEEKTHSLAEALESSRRSNEHMERLAYYDPLTGLANRPLLEQKLQAAGQRVDEAGGLAVVFLLDLHRFKRVNESLGRQVGDHLLQAVASDLQAFTGEVGTVARTEGNRFALLEETREDADTLRERAQALLGHVSRTFALGGYDLPVNVNLGVSLYPTDDEDPGKLLDHAEHALFRAKERGVNQFLFFTREMNRRALQRLGLESDLNRALDRDEFELFYQPQVDLNQGRVIGLEALLRWRHPERGMVSPGDFVPLLEDLGLIVSVGEWVLRTAARQLSRWREAGHSALNVAVNLSPYQFRDRDLVAKVEAVLRENRLPAEALHLEITESLFLEEIPGVEDVLQRLHGLGVGLVLDDFGTGYSALSYLQHFPLQVLKIDRSFVNRLTDNPRSADLVRGAVELGGALGMEAIAEGVETQDQVDFLREVDCPVGQGFGFSPPVPVEEAEALLSGRQGFAVGLPPVDPMAVINRHLGRQGNLPMASGRDGNLARALVDSLPGIYYLISETGELLWWNRHLEEVTGYGPEEIAGLRYEEFFSGRDREQVVEAFETVMREGHVTLEAHLMTRNGGSRPFFFNSTRMVAGGKGYITGLGLDITHQRQLEDQLRLLVTTDRLTGVANPFRCEEQLDIELRKARRYGRPFSLVLLDIDGFGEINEMSGHDVGDQVLQQVAGAIQGRLREVDLLGRWGGDEFIILAPETPLQGGRRLADKLQRAIAGERFAAVGDITVSFGAGAYLPEEDRRMFLKRVDDALYAAKKAGGNRLHLAVDEA